MRAKKPDEPGMVGPFWVVEADRQAAIIALAVPLAQADTYGDMLTVDTGHLEHWSQLVQRGARALREAGIPTTPVWSEYEEWPRGRVLYDSTARHFVIRADRQLHQTGFVHLIADHFCIDTTTTTVMPDEHYQCVRRVPVRSTTRDLPGCGITAVDSNATTVSRDPEQHEYDVQYGTVR